jgi:hypothetical protein
LKLSKTSVTENCDTIVNGQAPSGCDPSTLGDPAGTGDGIPSALCPSDYPLWCGNNRCCPKAFPACCGNPDWCGTDLSACDPTFEQPTAQQYTGSGSGQNSGGGADPSTCSTQQGLCVTVSFCADANGVNCYYTVNSRRFSCSSCADVASCMSEAVAYADQVCGVP